MAIFKTKWKATPKAQSATRARPKLVFVAGEGKKPSAAGHVVALTMVLALIGTTIFLMHSPTADRSFETFRTLHLLYQNQGLGAFRIEKQKLRSEVSESMQSGDSDSEARSIAVYLFPELLADDDFEKFEANSLWSELQTEIEKSPNTVESHQKFVELRAVIWNYENADRTAPQLSAAANQVIRIYEYLSAPNANSKSRNQ